MRYTATVLLLLLCIVLPKAYFGHGESSSGPLLYHFTHAGWLHLAINFFFILTFKPRLSTAAVAYIIATALAFCPLLWRDMPTCGLSGMCFAMLARWDAPRRNPRWWLMLANLALCLLPSFNGYIHIACYLTGYAIWKVFYAHKYAR